MKKLLLLVVALVLVSGCNPRLRCERTRIHEYTCIIHKDGARDLHCEPISETVVVCRHTDAR